MADLFRIAFIEMRCLEETSESSASDEPYAVFFIADLHNSVPKAVVHRTRFFENTDKGDLDKQWIRIWGPDQKPAVISDPDKVLILAALMENDESDPDAVATAARAGMFANLLSFASAGVGRSKMVSGLIASFKGALELGKAPGYPNSDDLLGAPQELRITAADLAAAKLSTQRRNLTFSGDGGRYRLGFDIAAGPGT